MNIMEFPQVKISIVMDEAYKIESNNNEGTDVIDNRALKFRKVIGNTWQK